jgi:hypothetical protein
MVRILLSFQVSMKRRLAGMVKKGEEQVSSMDSPRQGEKRNPDDPKIKHKGEGSQSARRGTPSEGSSKG